MMTHDEQEKILDVIIATAELMGHEMTARAAMIMVEDLSDYSYQAVRNALQRVRREKTGKLTLAAVTSILSPLAGWLAPSEAWALALPAADEAQTVVWTDEISHAWLVARPLLDTGDSVGARMAFIQSYERLVDDAKNNHRKPVYISSPGWDPQLRVMAERKAVAAGLLPPPEPAPVLQLNGPQFTEIEMAANRRRLFDNIIQISDGIKKAMAEHKQQIEQCKQKIRQAEDARRKLLSEQERQLMAKGAG